MEIEFTIGIREENGFDFEVEGEDADLTGIANPVEVALTIGDDAGMSSVAAEIHAAPPLNARQKLITRWARMKTTH